MKKVVDERQEKELLVIEHYGFWAMYWILFATIMYKAFLTDKPIFGGEWVAFMVGCFVIVIGCIKNGLWNYTSEPTFKNYMFYASIFSVIFSALGTFSAVSNFPPLLDNFGRVVAIFVVIFIAMFALLFTCLALVGLVVKKRRKKLEEKLDLED